MGSCLETEHSDNSEAFEEGTENWDQTSQQRMSRNVVTPSASKFPMHNNVSVQFEAPKVPVIFVLGGPGSGKVTHCDNLVQEKREIVHINMSDLLQQYAIGNDIPDYGQLSSRTVTEVLMVEMKMAPNAKTFLISGYPRNMRDVVEYADKIQTVNGVILISWRQQILERQIEYGANLGQVVLSLAQMELTNFYKNVIPVAEYFAQNKILIKIHGERHPDQVYKDFRAAFFEILSSEDNPPEFTTLSPIVNNNNNNSTSEELPIRNVPQQNGFANVRQSEAEHSRPKTQIISVANKGAPINFNSPVKPLDYPPVLWVIGGPGSNKALLCTEIAKENGFIHISLGKLMRAAAETVVEPGNMEINKIKDNISSGDLVSKEIIMKIVEDQIDDNVEAKAIILDGFPRNMEQASDFENKFKQKPSIILLDCSKLQLGKSRLDDSVAAFRRRLEVFRESTLPMLRTMDTIGRLTIVDGDTDTVAVREDFKSVVKGHMEYMLNNRQINNNNNNEHIPKYGNGFIPNGIKNGHIPNGNAALLLDLEPKPIQTISNGIAHNNNNINNKLLTEHSEMISSGHI